MLLLNGHASDDGCHLNLLRILHGDHSLDHVFDLDRQLSCWANNETFDAVKLGVFVAVVFGLGQRLDAEVEDGDAETEGLSLACAGCDDHVDVGLEVDETAGLHLGRVAKLVGL